jgi:DNA-binding transcriptional MocR family regulator
VYHLDPDDPKPLHIQLYEAIRSEIIAHCAVGDKLPSIRKVAQTYHLSKTTVESAFSQLFAKHLEETYEVLASGGGLAILIMPTVPFDWERFFAEAEKNRIKLYMAKERSGGEYEAIRMGFGGFGLEELEEAVAAFGEVWREALIS